MKSQCYHFLGTPSTAQAFVSGISNLRKNHSVTQKPIFVWEPEPRECNPENVHLITETAKMVDVFSPNHLELLRMFDMSPASGAEDLKRLIEQAAQKLQAAGSGRQGRYIVIIRAADLGCMVQLTGQDSKWFPPYYEPTVSPGSTARVSHGAVLDPTGAGNAFLGAFGAEMARSGDQFLVVTHAIIAASFVVEQTGLPKIDGKDQAEHERWSGVGPRQRLGSYMSRLERFGINFDLMRNRESK